jgi:hypothetical protein
VVRRYLPSGAWGDDPHREVDDPSKRRRSRLTASGILAVGIPLALLVVFFPLPFEDERGVREIVLTVLLGIASIALSATVFVSLRATVSSTNWERARHLAYDLLAERMTEEGVRARLSQAAEEDRVEPALRLEGVDLRSAVLPKADLRGAVLAGALMQGADLYEADLRLADLRGAKLTEADLSGAKVGGALYDDETSWPASVPLPRKLGAIHIEEIAQ